MHPTTLPQRLSKVYPFFSQHRGWPLRSGLVCCGLCALVTWWPSTWPRPVLNVSPSLPRGIYLCSPVQRVQRGMLILFPVPPAVTALVYARGWLPTGVPMMKPVAGLPGDTVCITETTVSVNQHVLGPVFRTDRQCRPLPVRRGCLTLAADEIFPLSTFIPYRQNIRTYLSAGGYAF